MGAQLVKEVASKTNDIAGDGTTTATVLAQAIIREGLRNVTAGSEPAADQARHRKSWSKRGCRCRDAENGSDRFDTPQKIAWQVASISANDKEIGGLIAEAMKAVGKDGVITVE